MKGLKAVADKTKGIDYFSRIPLYYSIQKDTVYAKDGDGRYLVTYLIRENTTKEIVSAVNRWKAL